MERGIVAVTDNVKTAGLIVYWHMSGAAKHEDLREAWLSEGLSEDLLPTLPTPRCALGRAVAEVKERRQLVRPLAAGWAFVCEHEEVSGELSYTQIGSVKLDMIGRLDFSPDTPSEICSSVALDYSRILFEHAHPDVSSWLKDQAIRLQGISLRDTGGVWFVPRQSADEWRRIANAIRLASAHVVYEIPALKSSEAVEAILDALSREAGEAAAKLEEALAAGDLSERALRSRLSEAIAMEVKLVSYEEQLGKALPDVAGRLEAVRANLAVAVLAKEAEEARKER